MDQIAKSLVLGLTPEQLNWQPVPGTWSVGQCVEHLCITNEVYVPAISGSLAGEPLSAVQEITPGWFARWFIRSYIEPSPQTKHARAPRNIVPSTRVEPPVLDRFLRGNQAVREMVRYAADYDVNEVRFRNLCSHTSLDRGDGTPDRLQTPTSSPVAGGAGETVFRLSSVGMPCRGGVIDPTWRQNALSICPDCRPTENWDKTISF